MHARIKLVTAALFLCEQVRSITGEKVLRILRGSGLAPALPEDLYQ